MNWYKRHKLAHQMYGYRVMTLDDNGNATDGFSLEKGSVHSKERGLYLSLDPDYVIDYYSHGSDDPEDPQEVLARYLFDSDDIMDGNITDSQTEFTVPSATLMDVKYLHPREEVESSTVRHELQFGPHQEGA